ncbi:MAG: phosphoribosylglycinamide formyltransferase [Candidatus Diapherotrites archaeon]
MEWTEMKKLRIAVLGSTNGSDLPAIIDAVKRGELNAEIVAVISNKQDAGILGKARAAGIEALFIDAKQFDSREKFDEKIVQELKKRKTELVLLIGYMKIVTPIFVHAFENRIMNIHPSLLPAFAGGMDKDVHSEVLNAGVSVTGCTLHFVTEEVDAGPVILQKAVKIENNDTVDSLKEKVQKAEQEIIIKAIKLFSEGKIHVKKGKVEIDG